MAQDWEQKLRSGRWYEDPALSVASPARRLGTNITYLSRAFLFVRLPASGIEVDLPMIGYFPPIPQPDAGIEPDLAVRDRQRDIAAGTDRVMRAALAHAALGTIATNRRYFSGAALLSSATV